MVSSNSTPSWRLKLLRAEKHLRDIKTELRLYADGEPYQAVRIGEPEIDDGRERWSYRLKITEQPDPQLALIVGDFVHNLRAALDHIAVALVPSARKSKASFAIQMQNIWEKARDGSYVINDDEARRRYQSAVEGMPDEAKTIIERLQPYHEPDFLDLNPLAVVSRLDNADKHSRLIALGSGIFDPTLVVLTVHGIHRGTPHSGYVKDGADVGSFDVHNARLSETEVVVQLRGAVKVAVQIQGGAEQYELPERLLLMRDVVARRIAELEPLIR